MSDPIVSTRVPSSDVLPAAEFFSLIRRIIGFREQPTIADPLSAVVSQISNNPEFAQSRLLKRILAALVNGGEFRRAEAATLDAPTCTLVIALLELRNADAHHPQSWVDAMATLETAVG